MDGLFRDFVEGASLDEPVYHIEKTLPREGLEELKRISLVYDVAERLPYAIEGKLSLDTLTTRLDEFSQVTGAVEGGTAHLSIAFTGDELELLQAVALDAGRNATLAFVNELCLSAHRVETAYKLDVLMPLEFRSELESSGSSSIDAVLAENLSFEILNSTDGSTEPRYRLALYLSPDMYSSLQKRSDPDEKPVGKLCHVLVEKVVEEFDVGGERAEVHEMLTAA